MKSTTVFSLRKEYQVEKIEYSCKLLTNSFAQWRVSNVTVCQGQKVLEDAIIERLFPATALRRKCKRTRHGPKIAFQNIAIR